MPPSRVHLAYSLSKTVTATAVGFLVQEGRLSLDDRVLDHFPELDRSVVADGWDDVRVTALPLDDGRARAGCLGRRSSTG